MWFRKKPSAVTPSVISPAPAPAAAGEPSAGVPAVTILLVDDSAMVRTVLMRLLTTRNYKVITANDGQQALATWDQHRDEIKLVVSDVFMPVMDGLAFATELRKRHRTLPVILMSSKLDEDSRWIAEEAGFRLISKPFKDELMIETIARMLRLAYPN